MQKICLNEWMRSKTCTELGVVQPTNLGQVRVVTSSGSLLISMKSRKGPLFTCKRNMGRMKNEESKRAIVHTQKEREKSELLDLMERN